MVEVLEFRRRIWPRFRRDGFLRTVYFTLSRFHLVRWAGDIFLALFQPTPRSDTDQTGHPTSMRSIFETVDANIVVSALREKSWYPNFNLRSELVDEINLAAKDSLLRSPLNPGFKFHQRDRSFAERHLGQPIVFADYPDLVDSCGAIATICNDPMLRAIAQKYLGREPRAVKPRLFMSFVAEAKNMQRLQQSQTIHFHYDTDAFRVLSFNFYLADIDENDGAHVLVEGTHGRKRLRHLLGTTNIKEEHISKFYPNRKIVVISGHKGFGFVEDCYCIHKALVPQVKNRRFLQIRCY